MSIFILSLGFIFFIISLILFYKVGKHESEITSKIINDWREELLEEVEDIRKEKEELINNYSNKIKCLENEISSDKTRAKEAKELTDKLVEAEHNRARIELEGAKALEEERLNKHFENMHRDLNRAYAKASEALEEKYEAEQFQLISDINTVRDGFEIELQQLKLQIKEFQDKRAAINEAIRLEEEQANEAEFHRIHLSELDKEDIHYLISIEDKIHNKELLHKLIWSEYIQRPFNQMIKNVLGGKSPKNVIYCIENLNTHKKYIGKTAGEVSKRWTEHIKSSLSIGTISHQQIHDALFGHWDEFAFSIIEEVGDEKLSDREKFYINTFGTAEYGYNMKAGG